MSDLAHLARLRHTFLQQRSRGYEAPAIGPSAIETDRRSCRRVIRELQTAGYLGPSQTTGGGAPYYTILPTVLDEIPPAKPDLVAMRDIEARAFSEHGISFDELAQAARHYIVLHPDEYIGTWSNGHRTIDWKIGTLAPKEVITAGYGWTLYIADPELAAREAARKRDARIADLFRRNLPHALKNFAAIDKEDADGWAIRDAQGGEPVGFGYSGLSRTLGHDPATWEADARAIHTKAAERVQRALDELASVTRVQVAVMQVGGWAKVAESLRAAVVDHIDNPKPEPEPTATETANPEETRS